MGSTALFSAIGTVALFVIASIFLRLARKAEEKVRIHNEVRSKIIVDYAQFERERDLLSQEISGDIFISFFENFICFEALSFERGAENGALLVMIYDIDQTAADDEGFNASFTLDKVPQYHIDEIDKFIISGLRSEQVEARSLAAYAVFNSEDFGNIPKHMAKALIVSVSLDRERYSSTSELFEKHTPIVFSLRKPESGETLFFTSHALCAKVSP